MPSAEVFGVCLKIPYSQISWHAYRIIYVSPLFFSASLFSDGGCNPLFQLYTPFIFHIFHGIPIKVTDLPSKPRFFMVNSDFWLVKSLKHLETLIEILEILHFFGRNLPRKLLRPQSLPRSLCCSESSRSALAVALVAEFISGKSWGEIPQRNGAFNGKRYTLWLFNIAMENHNF